MTGTPRQYTYRHRARPVKGGKNVVVIQRRVFGLFWIDWYPVHNAVRSLEHEASRLYDRLHEIFSSEYKAAEKYVKDAQDQLESGYLRRGKGVPFKGDASPREFEMSDGSERYKQVKKLFEKGQGRPGPGGTRSGYTLPQHSGLEDRRKVADGTETDHKIQFRDPQQQQHSNKRRGKQGGGQNPEVIVVDRRVDHQDRD